MSKDSRSKNIDTEKDNQDEMKNKYYFGSNSSYRFSC